MVFLNLLDAIIDRLSILIDGDRPIVRSQLNFSQIRVYLFKFCSEMIKMIEMNKNIITCSKNYITD